MRADTEVSAYEALSLHPRAKELTELARDVLRATAAARSPEPRKEDVTRGAEARELTHEDGETVYGNVLDVIGRGPETADERALARAVAACAVATTPAGDTKAEDDAAAELLWLALHTAFDATRLIDHALGERAPAMWDAIADRIRRIDDGRLAGAEPGEALVAAIALASSSAPAAGKLAAVLGAEVRDEKVAYVLARAAGETADGVLRGEMAPRPRGSVAAALLGLSGISLVMHAVRVLVRLAFAYRKPAELALSEDGGVRVRWRVELLGRTLRDGEVVVPRHGLAQAKREVRYPSLALYTALLALVVGSYVGASAFADGVRAGSPTLLATGLLLIALGLALDLVLSSLVPGVRGRCRLLLTPKDGSPVCLAYVDAGAADALLARLGRG
jgi:hypothetical protein